jgi:dynein heavy chain
MTTPQDIRLEYLEQIATMLLKFKPDKWSKLVGAEENMTLFTEFFEKPDIPVLVLTLNVAGMLVPCLGFPESLKSKGVYFIKSKPENINKDNYKTRLLYGDISPAPVDQLIAVVEEVCASRPAGGPGVRSTGVTIFVPQTFSEGPKSCLSVVRGPAASPGSWLKMQTDLPPCMTSR